jgi:hypothetical protein
LSIGTLQLANSNATLEITSGNLAGHTIARDDVLGTFLDQLDEFARTLAFEFNKLYSSGQGLRGFTQLTSEHFVSDVNAPLDAAGLPFTPVNGTFQVQLFDRETGLSQSFDIGVTLMGLGNDTTFTDLAAALDAINGISASLTTSGQLQIAAEGAGQEIAFADDTSGILAALGLNTFFSGTSAINLGVNETLLADPSMFAASREGIGEGTGKSTAGEPEWDEPGRAVRPAARRRDAAIGRGRGGVRRFACVRGDAQRPAPGRQRREPGRRGRQADYVSAGLPGRGAVHRHDERAAGSAGEFVMVSRVARDALG